MKRIYPLGLAVAIGLGIVAGGLWVLTKTLGTREPCYQGHPLDYWCSELTNRDATVSQRAAQVVVSQAIPSLMERMLRDTNDSSLRIWLVDALNGMPGAHITYVPADGRRAAALADLGNLGPQAKAAIPELLRALRGEDPVLRGSAAAALVKVQADPQTMIPALLANLGEPEKPGCADVAEALAEFGPQAKAAVPMLVKLMANRSSKDLMEAVRHALKKIDPETAAKVGAL